ncbi:MAG TPA: ATP-binding protein [Candidatus Binataceae bacterium]|nr:ATP-binding protein [Candidatus Binataceae bacterium]
MPHGQLLIGDPLLRWLDLVSDSIIAAVFCSIVLLLIYLIIKRRDLPSRSILWIFGIFILSCGITHVLDALTIWYPAYWAVGVAKAVTAIAALACAVGLVTVGPGALAVPTQSRLEDADLELRQKVVERNPAQGELVRARDEALEGSRLKSAFVANMSHELRTPLNGIIGLSQLLYAGHIDLGSAEYKRSLGDILSSARHLLSLINNVLDLTKVESGNMEFTPEPVEPAPLVEEVCGVLRAVAGGNNIEIEAEIAPELSRLMLDSGKLRQVLYNYVSNALKFSAHGAHVTIRMRPEGAEWFRLEVEDNGEGIRAGDLRYLFTEFHQLDSFSGKRHQGTGLGLALTRRIVEAQGGSVGVTSEPGKGSIFWAVLPRCHSTGNGQSTIHS